MQATLRSWHPSVLALSVVVTMLSTSGCGSSSGEKETAGGGSLNVIKVNRDAGDTEPRDLESGAPPAEVEIDGRPWLTSDPGPRGDPRAEKGGSIRTSIPNWPATLRTVGKASNTYLNSIVEGLCYESLLGTHPVTLEFTPKLATHWHISDDKKTFRFRINPNARWADGKPITADDVIATHRLSQDSSLQDPMFKQVMGKFETPRKLSEFEVEVTCKEIHWRNFISFSQTSILPAHIISKMTGEEYLDTFNFAYPVGSGPYKVVPADIKKGQSIALTRRDDHWAKDAESNVGLYNFDRIHFIVVRQQRLALQKAMKGDLDFYAVYTAKWWVEDLDPLEAPDVERGLLVRQKVYTKNPVGVQGFAINMRDPLLEDARVRKALCHLYDRRSMLSEFAYDEYVPSKSLFPKGDGENPDNEMSEYNPKLASQLLAEAGWSQRDGDGFLVKNGQRLSLSLLYRNQGFEKYLTVFQAACKRAGVQIKLQLVAPETHWKNMMDRKFQLAGMAWTGSLFPNPKLNWSSDMADAKNTNNITGVKSDKIDAIMDRYDVEFDFAKRNEILRELDAELYGLTPYVLDWYSPAERLLYWNRFGTPEYVLPRYADWRDVFGYWWVDVEKDRELKRAKNKPSMKMTAPPDEVDYWETGAADDFAVNL